MGTYSLLFHLFTSKRFKKRVYRQGSYGGSCRQEVWKHTLQKWLTIWSAHYCCHWKRGPAQAGPMPSNLQHFWMAKMGLWSWELKSQGVCDNSPPYFFLRLDIRHVSAARNSGKAVLELEQFSKHLASVNLLRHIAESSSIPQTVIMHLGLDGALIANYYTTEIKTQFLTHSYLPVNLPGLKALCMTVILSWKVRYMSLEFLLPWLCLFTSILLYLDFFPHVPREPIWNKDIACAQ